LLPSSGFIRERSLFRAGEGVDDIREGLWIFGKCWRRGYGIPIAKKGGVTRINGHFIHSKEYDFIVLVSH